MTTIDRPGPRLCDATLQEVTIDPAVVSLPRLDTTRMSTGIVHLGVGAFHRAHQAVYTEVAMAQTNDLRWGILGVTGRTDTAVRRLDPQDCRYGLLVKDAGYARLRVVGSIKAVFWPGRETDRVADTIASPDTHIVSVTITEKGYRATAERTANLDDPTVAADVRLLGEELVHVGAGVGVAGRSDVERLRAAQTPLGLLAIGLARRFARNGNPLTVVSCDNLRQNGHLTHTVVRSLIDAAKPPAATGGAFEDFVRWFDSRIAFPCTMVDRITPATTDDDRVEEECLLGLRDAALVVTEPFSQWVIEDRFAGPRPAWEKAGATFTTDVACYERMKLHILNSAHSMLAYLGILRGHTTIAQAADDPDLREAVVRMIDEDVIPTLVPPDGMALADYRDSVLHRFANPALRHTTRQIAMDGSQKMPIRILETAAEALAAGHTPHGLALAVAAWMVYIAQAADGVQESLDDPLAPALLQAVVSVEHLRQRPADSFQSLLDVLSVPADDALRGSTFAGAVSEATRSLTTPERY
jgi:fructuronate reductase